MDGSRTLCLRQSATWRTFTRKSRDRNCSSLTMFAKSSITLKRKLSWGKWFQLWQMSWRKLVSQLLYFTISSTYSPRISSSPQQSLDRLSGPQWRNSAALKNFLLRHCSYSWSTQSSSWNLSQQVNSQVWWCLWFKNLSNAACQSFSYSHLKKSKHCSSHLITAYSRLI